MSFMSSGVSQVRSVWCIVSGLAQVDVGVLDRPDGLQLVAALLCRASGGLGDSWRSGCGDDILADGHGVLEEACGDDDVLADQLFTPADVLHVELAGVHDE